MTRAKKGGGAAAAGPSGEGSLAASALVCLDVGPALALMTKRSEPTNLRPKVVATAAGHCPRPPMAIGIPLSQIGERDAGSHDYLSNGHSFQKLPRYRRSATPPRMLLTARDLRILNWVYSMRFITRDQIQQLEFPSGSTSQCKRRLTLLYHNGYLERLYVPLPLSYGASRAAYCLDRRGAEILACDLAAPMGQLDWRPRDRDKELYFLEHTLAVNDALILFILASRLNACGCHWEGEKELRRRMVGAEGGPASVIVPDAYLQVQQGSRACGFAIEVDRGTVEEKPFKRKVRGYGELVASGIHRELLGLDDLRILFVVTGRERDPRRLERIKRWTEAVGGRSLFWFAELACLSADSLLYGPVWFVGGRHDRHSLLEVSND